MKARVIIILDQPTPEQREAVSKFIQSQHEDSGIAWWHWFQDVFLVVDETSGRSTNWWVQEIQKVAKDLETLVLGISEDRFYPGTWSGFMDEKAAKWLRENF